MVVNMNMHDTQEGNINQYLSDTISSVFSEVYTADVPNCTNRELFASDSPEMLARLRANTADIEDSELRYAMRQLETSMTPYEAGAYCMTDDQAPVEVLSMRVIDGLIQKEVGYYKQIYQEQGIEGVFHLLT